MYLGACNPHPPTNHSILVPSVLYACACASMRASVSQSISCMSNILTLIYDLLTCWMHMQEEAGVDSALQQQIQSAQAAERDVQQEAPALYTWAARDRVALSSTTACPSASLPLHPCQHSFLGEAAAAVSRGHCLCMISCGCGVAPLLSSRVPRMPQVSLSPRSESFCAAA